VKLTGDSGNILWAQQYHATPSSRDKGTDIAVDAAGRVFVVGHSDTRSADSTDLIVLSYAPDGTPGITVRYHYVLIDGATAVVPDEMGGCYVAGYSSRSNTNLDFVVIHYDSLGATDWFTRLNGPSNGNDRANALVADGAGNLYATGYAWTGTSSRYAYYTAKLDAATGDTAWTAFYNGTAGIGDPYDDVAHAIAVDDSGNVYVTGRAGEQATYYDATTVKYDATGSQVWAHRFDAGRNAEDGAGAIAVDADGHVYCGGFTYEYYIDSDQDWLVYGITPGGATDWQQVYDAGVEDIDSCAALVLDDNSNVYATGITSDITSCLEWLTAKYNSHGVQSWMSIHGVYDEDDEANDIVLDDMGNVFVGGVDLYSGGEDYAVIKYSEADVAAILIIAPTDTLRYGAEMNPRAWVRNYGATSASFPVWLGVGNTYFDAQNVVDLAPYDSVLVEFATWVVHDVGNHEVVCYTMLPGDKEPENDTTFGFVTTVYVWEQLASIPYAAVGRQREVKDGGSLVYASDTLICGFKGNNTVEFYKYNIQRDTWVAAETIPSYGSTGRKKRVKRGARLEVVDNNIYALKGNNTVEFWRYSLEGDSAWVEKANYPIGGGRRIKGGSGLEYVPASNLIYSCKGSKTLEFYAYDVAGDSWIRKADVGSGPRGKTAKYGTCMTYDGDNTIYLLKGYRYEFHAYSISGDTWTQKPDIPLSTLGGRKKKIKKGAGIAYDPELERVYASKGGKSIEWWYFDVARDTWVETPDQIPLGPSNKPQYYGSCMEYGGGKIYFLKGYKTNEFWKYNSGLMSVFGADVPGGVMTFGSAPTLARPELAAVPNPFVGRTALRYSLPVAGRVRVTLHDVTGRVVRNVVDEFQASGSYSVTVRDDGLAAGVYLARLVAVTGRGTLTATRKVLVAR
jgi:hypothetical protein